MYDCVLSHQLEFVHLSRQRTGEDSTEPNEGTGGQLHALLSVRHGDSIREGALVQCRLNVEGGPKNMQQSARMCRLRWEFHGKRTHS